MRDFFFIKKFFYFFTSYNYFFKKIKIKVIHSFLEKNIVMKIFSSDNKFVVRCKK